LGERFINGSGAWRGEVVNACLELTSLRATNWVVNLHGEQLLTFGDMIAISTPPGTTSGLLPLDGICG
jgi:hypothetical protein